MINEITKFDTSRDRDSITKLLMSLLFNAKDKTKLILV